MTVLQALDGYYDRMDARGEVVAPGWADEPVGVVLVLGRDGTLLRAERRWDRSGKKAQKARVPKWFGRSGTGSTPFFLWDNTAYALGISDKKAGKTALDHAAFRALHAVALAGTEDEGLLALRAFVEAWTPERFGDAPFDAKMVEQNVAFELDGQGPIHARPAAAALVEALRTAGERRAEVECLVTGRRLPPVRLHPKIKGVDGTAAAEVPLVSFQQDSFQSYGNVQGANAPTSEAAAFRYGAALNRLLDREENTNRLKVADATVAFWADASGAEAAAEKAAAAADALFAALMVPPPTDANQAVEIRDILEKIRDGRPASALVAGVEPGTTFHVLGLAPNAARLSIRFWLTDSFDAFAARLADHHADLALSPAPLGWTSPPSVQRLLVRTTALMGKFENIPPPLAGETMRAVLSGTPYPRTLLAAAVLRLRAGDGPGSGWHAAVIKACINRPLRRTVERLRREGDDPAMIEEIEKTMLKVGLNTESSSAAYQLGRLFCVLESAQRAALGQVNASIADRYYGAASATPARVFGPLLRNLRVHVADARRRGFGGWIEPRVAEIMSHLPDELPRTLKLEDQGRFAVGYYHERGTRSKAKDEEATLAAAAESTEAVEGGNI